MCLDRVPKIHEYKKATETFDVYKLVWKDLFNSKYCSSYSPEQRTRFGSLNTTGTRAEYKLGHRKVDLVGIGFFCWRDLSLDFDTYRNYKATGETILLCKIIEGTLYYEKDNVILTMDLLPLKEITSEDFEKEP